MKVGMRTVSTSQECCEGPTKCRRCQNGTRLRIRAQWRGMAVSVSVLDEAAATSTSNTVLSRPEEESPESPAGWDFLAARYGNFHISPIGTFSF